MDSRPRASPATPWARFLLVTFLLANVLGSACVVLILLMAWAVSVMGDGSNTNGPAAGALVSLLCLFISAAQALTLFLVARTGRITLWWLPLPLLQAAAALLLLVACLHLESQLAERYR
ncbi:hypothetical protein [Actinomadura craniellae]|nr:hypothetical protein [Actinomadura craniellae]